MKAVGDKKTCSACREVLDLNSFHKNKAMPDGLHSQCKSCNNAARKLHKQKNPGQHKKWNQKNPHDFLARHGVDITAERFYEMLDEQDGKCLICGHKPEENEKRLCIDHDHKTNKVRGLLCDLCNRGLGMFRDNPDFLIAAARYLQG
jgi:hypothetical protein